jgi:hypothetical protein
VIHAMTPSHWHHAGRAKIPAGQLDDLDGA